ncbi:MAG: hypothetical protein J5X22_23230 [Candidatus Accumulibacter sp.]|uniref:Uncharacterized protein n=1 Tax=Candidatus Accumulibacter phosphatis TaxID=327160 RepID=A0A5S4EHI7_9PROT|nr:hypothetical protein [Accumulibacter sp.]MBO3713277.1 hypothetical protein [Accumulibacter sp.]TMQ74768.1 hypothetical protein ACCUM_3113 [Candidatus Accumulibacter phosphatis]
MVREVERAKLWRILNEQPLKPPKVRNDLERRDPDFDRKREEVLMVYRRTENAHPPGHPGNESGTRGVSLEEIR